MRQVEERLEALGATDARRAPARFVAVLCLAFPDGERDSSAARSRARWSGRRAATTASATIRCSCRDGYDQTFGEMSADAKHGWSHGGGPGLSHRARAFARFAEARLDAMSGAEPGFGVYVHWPFCAAKCPYCDFNSHVRHQPPDQARFARAFAREIATTADRAPGRTVSSIFLGGGTPSLMEPATVGAILDAIAKHWRSPTDAEVTLEANPSSVEAERFRGYRAAGRQPGLARRPGAERRRPPLPRPPAQRRRGVEGDRDRAARPSRGSPST